jgi:hypothetical protein
VTVNYYFTGLANEGVDFTDSGNGSVTLAAGVTNATVTITPVNHTTPDPNRTVILNIESDPSFQVGIATATLTIYDDNAANAMVWYMFTGDTTAEVYDTNVIANSATGVGGLSAAYYISAPDSWLFNGSLTPNTEAGAVANNTYLSLVVAPTAGHALTFTNLEFQAIYGNYSDLDTTTTGAVVFVRSSVDNFTSDLGSFALVPDTAGGWWVTNEVLFGSAFANLNSSVEFRLYAYDDTSVSSTGIRVDNIFLRGNSSAAVSKNQVSVVAYQPNASEPSTEGAFSIYRYGSTSASLNVSYSVGGTAVAGVDYTALSGTANIPAGATNVIVSVDVINHPTTIDPTRTVVLALQTNANYVLLPPTNDTVSIADNKTGFSVAATDNNAYKRQTNLSGWFTITRAGNLNSTVTVSFALGGSAVLGSDYVPSATNSVAFGSGVSSLGIQIVPVESGVLTGDRTVSFTLLPSSSYLFTGQTNDMVTVVDDQLPAAPVLWSDNFDAGNSGSNYVATSTTSDYATNAAFDYSTIGLAPEPGTSTTIGLQLMADLYGAHRAAVNLYPIGQSFSNNFALRFSAYTCFDYASDIDQNLLLFGINQSGAYVNYVTDASGWPAYGEGIFGSMAIRAGQPDIFDLYAVTNSGAMPARVAYAEEQASIFNSPPYTELGRPDNFYLGSTRTWVEIELSQVANVITLKANNTVILQYTNTAAIATNGSVFVGFCHASDNQPSLNTYAVVDNLRVVSLASATQPMITSITVSGGNVTIAFTGSTSDSPSAFGLQSCATVNGTYTNNGSAVITGSNGSFQAVAPASGASQFYRIRR